MSSSALHKSCLSSPWGKSWPHPKDQYSYMYNEKNLKSYIFSIWRRLVLPYLNPANQAPWVQTGQAPGDQ